MHQFYRVSFYTNEGGIKHWHIDVTANRCRDAKQRARNRWKHWDAWSGVQMVKVRASRRDYGATEVDEWFTENS